MSGIVSAVYLDFLLDDMRLYRVEDVKLVISTRLNGLRWVNVLYPQYTSHLRTVDRFLLDYGIFEERK